MESYELTGCRITHIGCLTSSPADPTTIVLEIKAEQMARPQPEDDEEQGLVTTATASLRRNWLLKSPPLVRRLLSTAMDSYFVAQLCGATDTAVDMILDYCVEVALEMPKAGHTLWLDVEINLLVDNLPDVDDGDWINFFPASDESIENLETLRIETTGKECVVCLGDMLVGSEVTRLPCSHSFHGHCIVRWLKINKSCPVCRFELPD